MNVAHAEQTKTCARENGNGSPSGITETSTDPPAVPPPTWSVMRSVSGIYAVKVDKFTTVFSSRVSGVRVTAYCCH